MPQDPDARPAGPPHRAGGYRLAILDFDGTLADSAAIMAHALDQAAERFGFRRTTAAEKAALRGLDAPAVLRALGLPARKLPLVVRFLRQQAAEQADRMRLFPGTADMLRLLAGHGVVTAVVSSNAEGTVRRIMGPGCAVLVGSFACSAPVFGKAARFRRVLRRTGIGAADAVAIGDEVRDLEAAAACGLASGAVCWGYTTPARLRQARPTLVFDRMDQIAPAIVGRTAAAAAAAFPPAHAQEQP